MQGQPPYKTTPEQGWSGMEQVLNKEMPVVKRNRRFPIFWWNVAAVALIAALAFFAPRPTEKTDEQIVPQDNSASARQEIAQSSIETDISKSISSDVNTVDTQASDAKEKEIIAGMPGNASGNTNRNELKTEKSSALHPNTDKYSTDRAKVSKVNKVDLTSNHHALAVNEKQAEENFVKNDLKTNNASAIDIGIEINDNSQAISFEQSTSTQLSIKNSDLLDPLPSLAIADLDVPVLSIDDHMSIEPADRKRKALRPYVVADGMKSFSKGASIYGGAGLEFPVAGRLSAFAEFGYSHYEPTFGTSMTIEDEQNFELDDLLKYDLSYQGIGGYLPSADFNAVPVAVANHYVKSISQLEPSAGIKYQISNRFYASGGIAVGFGARAKSTFPIIDYDPLVSNGVPIRVSKSINEHRPVNAGVTKLMASVGYRVSGKFDAYVKWTHGVDYFLTETPSPLIDATDHKDYIRGLGLGLKYYL